MTAAAPKPGERPCKLCRMPLVFVKGPSGRVIPLQRVRRFYEAYTESDSGERRARALSWDDREPDALYVSHFETCPKASTFSKRKAARS